MKTFILGAGASKAYNGSKTGLKMPIACDFFEIFSKLEIYHNPWALREALYEYLLLEKKVDPEEYLSSSIDIEELHSEIEARFRKSLGTEKRIDQILKFRAYNELIFIFSAVINSIQNGTISKAHQNLAKMIEPTDQIITFNWDTLMDRALSSETTWRPDFGYGFSPKKIFRDEWLLPKDGHKQNCPQLLKLHGSTNWLTSSTTLEEGTVSLTQESTPETVHVFEYATKPFDAYAGRYMGDFGPYSYGYYPPNIFGDIGRKAPDGFLIMRIRQKVPWKPEGNGEKKGLISMPLIIPPVKYKTYDLFGELFSDIWRKSEEAITNSSDIIIIGYSFPQTDTRTNFLFLNAFSKRKTIPNITIIDPYPEKIAEKFIYEFGIPPGKINIKKEYFSDQFNFDDL